MTKSIGRDRAALGRSDAQFTKQSNDNSRSRMRQLEREARDSEIQHERTRRSFLAGLSPGGRRATGIAGLAGAITGGTVAAAPISGATLSALSTMPALAAGIAPLVGTLPAIGAGALGAAEGLGVMKLATEGLWKVINAETPKQLASALQGLDKHTQKLAYAFHKELHPALNDLQELAQKTVLPSLFKLGYAFTQLAKPKGAIFDGMQAAGKSLGKVINSVSNLLNDKAFSKQLDHLLVGVGQGIGQLVHILPPMLDLFVRVENLAVPFADRIGTAIGHWADKADDFVRNHGKEITQFFSNAFDTLQTWGHAIGDITGIFVGLSRAAGDLSHALGQGITHFLDQINTFVNSKQGQQALKDFFASALPTLRSFGSLVKNLFGDLGKLGADPATQTFVKNLFDFLGNVILPQLDKVAGAIPKIATSLEPVMGTLSEFVNVSLSPLLDAIIKLVQVALPPLVPLVKSIAELLKTPLDELTHIVDLLAQAMKLLGSVGGPGSSMGGAMEVALLGGAFSKRGAIKDKAVDPILEWLTLGLLKPKPKLPITGFIGSGKGRQAIYSAGGGAAGVMDAAMMTVVGSKEAKDGARAVLQYVPFPGLRKVKVGSGVRYQGPGGKFAPTPPPLGEGQAYAPVYGVDRRGRPYYYDPASGHRVPAPPREPLRPLTPEPLRVGEKISTGVKGFGRGFLGFDALMAALSGLDVATHKGVFAGIKNFGQNLVEPFGNSAAGGVLAGAGFGASAGGVPGAIVGAVAGLLLHGILHAGQDQKAKAVNDALNTGGGYLKNYDIKGFNKYYNQQQRTARSLATVPVPVGAPGSREAQFTGKDQGQGLQGDMAARAQATVDALKKLRDQAIAAFGPEVFRALRGETAAFSNALISPFEQALHTTGSVMDALGSTISMKLDAIQKDFGSLKSGPGLRHARQAVLEFSDVIGKAIGNDQIAVGKGIDAINAYMKKIHAGPDFAKKVFNEMAFRIQQKMDDGTLSVKDGTSKIVALLTGLHAGTHGAERNFKTFAGVVAAQMAAGVTSVQQGTAEMAAATDSYLHSLGATPFVMKQIHKAQGAINKALGPAGDPTRNPITSSPFGGQRGLMTVGREGMVGGDNVPAMFNGRPAVVAEGENIAVFNRHQRAELNARLADVGGLRGFFESRRKKHTDPMAFSRGGGLDSNDGFFPASGTNYSVGQEPQIAARLDRLAHALHLHLIGLSGWRSPQHSVQVGGFPNDPHTKGAASDTPGIEGVSESVLEKFGLTRPFGGAAERDHIQLLAGAMGKVMGGGMGGAAFKKLHLNLAKSGLPGAIGKMADRQLKIIHDAMVKKAEGAAGGTGGLSGGTSGANQALGRKMMLAMGWGADQWPALKALWTRESGWNQNARNPSSGAYGIPQALGHGNVFGANPADQIRWGLNYIKGRYGSPSGAWAHEQSVGWYGVGGMTSRSTDGASDGNPNTPTGPDLNGGSTPPSTGKKKKKGTGKGKKGHKNGRPFSAGPDVPRLSGLRPGGGKGKSHIPGYGKKLIDLRKLVDGDTLPDTSLNGDPNYDPTLALYNGMPEAGGYPDLTNYLTAHPELLRQFKGHPNGVAEFIDYYGEELEVLNTTNPSGDFSIGMGLYNQGVFTPGIPEEVRWLVGQRDLMKEKLLGTKGAWGGRSGQGATKGYLADLKYLHRSWLHYKKLQRVDTKALKKYERGHMSWQDKVDIGQQKVDLIENWLSGYRDDAVSHRMSAHAKHEKIQMEGALKKAREDIAKAKKDKTPATGTPPHKTKSESDAAYRAKLNTWKDQQRGDKTHAGKLRSDIAGWNANLTYIDEDQFSWNTKQGMAGQYMDGIVNLRGAVSEINKKIKTIYGTRIMPPQVGDGGGGGSSDGTAELADLQKQMADNIARNNALAAQQLAVTQGFAPLAGARMIGAFDHGGVVPRTGMALVHKGEFINPAPQGAYRNGQNSAASVTGGDTTLEVHLHGGLDAAVERAVMKHGPRIIKMTSEQQGRRARMIGTAPGRGR